MKTLIKGATVVSPDSCAVSDISIDDGFITNDRNTRYDEIIDASGLYAIPGFIDTHIHGIGGAGTEDSNPEAILRMSETLAAVGVTSFFPTTYTDTSERMLRDVEAIADAKGNEQGADIAGIHIEGPFISPNRIGAQNPLGRKNPDAAFFQKLIYAGKGLVKAMTAAPELPGIEDIARLAERNSIRLLMGHTDATYEEAMKAMDLGIRHATHLFNAMTGFSHRKPGVAGCALMHDEMYAEIIADGAHVHKDITMFLIRAKGPDKVAVITDSLKPTLQTEGELTANGVPVVMGPGLWATKGKPDLYQGSALTMLKAFRNLAGWGLSLSDAVAVTSTTPAAIYNLTDRGIIEAGRRADILLLSPDLGLNSVFIKGIRKCGTTI